MMRDASSLRNSEKVSQMRTEQSLRILAKSIPQEFSDSPQ